MGEPRKLAAILVADVVGYSRLAAVDEDRTLARLRGLRSDLKRLQGCTRIWKIDADQDGDNYGHQTGCAGPDAWCRPRRLPARDGSHRRTMRSRRRWWPIGH